MRLIREDVKPPVEKSKKKSKKKLPKDDSEDKEGHEVNTDI
jgi:hypothetical protein